MVAYMVFFSVAGEIFTLRTPVQVSKTSQRVPAKIWPYWKGFMPWHEAKIVVLLCMDILCTSYMYKMVLRS